MSRAFPRTNRKDPSQSTIIVFFSALTLLVHLLTNGRYGYFRDELYYIACARHLAFGYVDQPPLSLLLLRLNQLLLGDSLFAIRLLPALAGAAIVALTGMIAREMGGRAWTIALACAGSLCALFNLAVGNFFSMNAFEPLFWMGCGYLIVRILNGGSPTLWFWSQGSVTKHLLHMSAFLAASMLVQTLYLLADLYWVGHLGKEAIAAVGVVGNLMMIVLALAQMLGVGTTTLLSHAAGRKDQAHAEAVFNQSFVMSIAIAFGLGIVGFILRPAYCDWLSADAATAELGKSLPALVSPGAVTPVSSCCAGVSAARHRHHKTSCGIPGAYCAS